MNRIRLLIITAVLWVGLTAAAQQNSGVPRSAAQDQPTQRAAVTTAEDHLKMLSQSLNLTAEQQEKLRPIIQNMLDQRQRVMHDQSLSAEQRQEKLRALHEKAHQDARKFLNDEQNKKLDELEAQHQAASAAHAQH